MITNKKLLWKVTQFKRNNFERIFTLRVKSMLNKQFKGLADRITATNYNSEILIDTITKEPVEKALIELYKTVGVFFAKEQLNKLKSEYKLIQTKEDHEDEWAKFMEQYIKTQAGKKIVSIAQESRDQAKKIIRRHLEESIDKGLGADETARAIRKGLVAESIEMNQWRALRIARTEVMSASNLGSMEGAKATELPMNKFWIATYDERTRDTHMAVEQQNPKAMDDTFNVGGYEMQQPGDDAGGPEEVINCRCGISFEVIGY